MKCSLCPRSCNAERTLKTNNIGYCKMPLLPRVARADLHFWEEPCISGDKGSGTIFFSGCSLSCVYCQNFDISHKEYGKDISFERLSDIFKELEDKGAHNINLVNPTHYVYAIKKALDIYKPKIPIVYNSGGYDKTEVLKSLREYVDIYLLDFKYIDSNKAMLYSNAKNYPLIAKNAILECYSQNEVPVFKDGIMQKGLIIRHLVLPKATNDAIKIFDWYRENTPNAYFSLMSQYCPLGKAEEYKDISRKITTREYEKVLDYIMQFETDNVFIQEKSSNSSKYVPKFDLTGV